MQQMPCCGHKVNININKKRQKRQHISTALTIYCSQATATATGCGKWQQGKRASGPASGQPASLVGCKAISLWHKQRHNFDLIARYSLKNKMHVVATCGKWQRAGVAQKLRNFDVQRPSSSCAPATSPFYWAMACRARIKAKRGSQRGLQRGNVQLLATGNWQVRPS